MTERSALSRAKFLRLASRIAFSLAGILGLGGLVRFFSHAPATGSPTSFHIGSAAAFPPSGKLTRSDIPAVILKTAQGFQALSLICTHLGCTLEENNGGFSCPCHGSVFAADGAVIKGPAGEDLQTLEVEITSEGELWVHKQGGGL
jgi:cytochrome b6-f complex iron-sulfur subunit